MTICSNHPCTRQAVCKGRCKTCDTYTRRHPGVERPLDNPVKSQCQNPECRKLSGHIVKDRCPACYVYWKRHGVDRNAKDPDARCSNCAQGLIYCKGRCTACYWHLRNHGEERPPNAPRRRKATAHKCFNPNCSKTIIHAKRCSSCQRHWRLYGKERSWELCVKKRYLFATVKPKNCKVCKNPRISSNGRCEACDTYYRRNGGKARPRWLWDKTVGCLTCGKLLASLRGNQKRAGRCKPCYSYLLRTGRERPRELWMV